MKQILYIVTSGDYSDYGIDGVFDTKELAQKYIDSFDKDNDFNEIEEYILNPNDLDLKANRKPYHLKMDIEGKAEYVEQSNSPYGHKKGIEISFAHKKDWMNIYCFANDEKHAIKIANEKRTQILALNRWGQDDPL